MLKKNLIYFIILIIIVICSFLLYMISLSFYPISYGPDGPYYDLQVRYILTTGFPESNDPPLVYYYLTIFVLLTNNSFLGIKLGMSVIAAAMAIPAYYLTGIFTEKVGIESKIPCLLSAFLITFNVYCLRMIEDFMQNLAGTFFILVFLYFTTKWFENMKQLYPNGILAFLAFTCAIFCHVFTAALALALFGILFIFNLFIKAIKMRKFPKKEFLIIMILIILSLAIFILLIILYPTTITNFISRFKSFFNSIFNADSKINEIYRFGFLVFLNIPYILGIWCTFYFLSNNLRKNVSNRDIKSFPDKTYLAFSYIFLAILLFLLIIIPSTWQEQFLLIAFLPIGLIIP